MTAPALEIRGLVAGYGDITVVRGVDLSVGAGEVVAVLGANGAGKTTMLSAIAGLLPARGGSIVFEGSDVTRLPAHARSARGLALVQQGKRIFQQRTVEENLLLGGYRLRARSRPEAIEREYSRFPILRQKRRAVAGTLSGGQQQMLAIAQALIPSPRVLMLDEPSGGLAPIVVEEVLDAVRGVRRDGMTVVIVEQLIDQALSVADRVAVLDRGSIALSAAVDSVDPDALRRIYLGDAVEAADLAAVEAHSVHV